MKLNVKHKLKETYPKSCRKFTKRWNRFTKRHWNWEISKFKRLKHSYCNHSKLSTDNLWVVSWIWKLTRSLLSKRIQHFHQFYPHVPLTFKANSSHQQSRRSSRRWGLDLWKNYKNSRLNSPRSNRNSKSRSSTCKSNCKP